MEEKPETIRPKAEVTGPTFSGTATQEFMNVFHQLDNNINGELVERAWRQFDTIRQQVVLEVSLELANRKLRTYSGQQEGVDRMLLLHDCMADDTHRTGAHVPVLRFATAEDLQLKVCCIDSYHVDPISFWPQG